LSGLGKPTLRTAQGVGNLGQGQAAVDGEGAGVELHQEEGRPVGAGGAAQGGQGLGEAAEDGIPARLHGSGFVQDVGDEGAAGPGRHGGQAGERRSIACRSHGILLFPAWPGRRAAGLAHGPPALARAMGPARPRAAALLCDQPRCVNLFAQAAGRWASRCGGWI